MNSLLKAILTIIASVVLIATISLGSALYHASILQGQISIAQQELDNVNAEIAAYNETSVIARVVGSGKSARELRVQRNTVEAKCRRLSEKAAQFEKNPWTLCLGL